MGEFDKQVKYLGKDFGSLRNNLIEYAKTYYPTVYNDFNESSPAMMLVEMSAYVGDVLGYYIDDTFKETLLPFAQEKFTIYNIAQSLGYKPRFVSPAIVELTLTQTVPANTDDNLEPDFDYALNIKFDSRVVGDSNGTEFRLLEDCNFKVNSSSSPRTFEIITTTSTGSPSRYKLTKRVKAISGAVKSETFPFGSATKYDSVLLKDTDITDIISVTDSNDSDWYEVPFLAQDTVLSDFENNIDNDKNLVQFAGTVPYVLKLLKTSKRFTTFRRSDKKTELRFGAGILVTPDEELVPNPTSVGSTLSGSPTKLGVTFDPLNFTNTRAYGEAPSNTVLTVKYSVGGDVTHNVRVNDLNSFSNLVYGVIDSSIDIGEVAAAKDSLTVTNLMVASGGQGEESVEEIKSNALSFFQAQSRSVTREDYVIRSYSMPPKYGSVAKSFIVQNDLLEIGNNIESNPLALNMYILGYTPTNKLTTVNNLVKQNLSKYLGESRILTDAINIKDAYIINIGIKYNILVKRGNNKYEVLLRATKAVQDYFRIEKWQINQPIVTSDIANAISSVDGVAGVIPPKTDNPFNLPVVVENKWNISKGYNEVLYDFTDPTIVKNGVIYPAKDPSIFELKFPNVDIEGKVVGDVF
ncbi:MAG: hypothetical protein H8E03_01195 [Pelagibacteraceae bacterium]|nr:hypothetical protein [Pelagibacteraceae bacterium]